MTSEDLKCEEERSPHLAEREMTHGKWEDTSYVAQGIKAALREQVSDVLDSPFTESLDLIATKMSRIVSGNARTLDHWEDIKGYAQLAIEYIKKTEGK